MMPFFWSGDHIGWPLFALLVFSVCCLIVADIVWRVARFPFRRLLLAAGSAWTIGVAAVIVLYCF
jgi:hypothetical protein